MSVAATDGQGNDSDMRSFDVQVTNPGTLAFGSNAIVTDGGWEAQCQQWGSNTCLDPRLRNAVAFSFITSCPYSNHGFSDPSTDWMGLFDNAPTDGQTGDNGGDCNVWCLLAGHSGAVSTSETGRVIDHAGLNFYTQGSNPSGTLCNGKPTPNTGCCTYPPSNTNAGSSIQ